MKNDNIEIYVDISSGSKILLLILWILQKYIEINADYRS